MAGLELSNLTSVPSPLLELHVYSTMPITSLVPGRPPVQAVFLPGHSRICSKLQTGPSVPILYPLKDSWSLWVWSLSSLQSCQPLSSQAHLPSQVLGLLEKIGTVRLVSPGSVRPALPSFHGISCFHLLSPVMAPHFLNEVWSRVLTVLQMGKLRHKKGSVLPTGLAPVPASYSYTHRACGESWWPR